MPSTLPARPAHLGWRLLALTYDAFPLLALALAFGALLTAAASLLGHADISDLPWLRPITMAGVWATWGGYFCRSWRRGGATLGMRPWRLRVLASNGQLATWKQLWRRYAWASLPALVALEALPWLGLPNPRWSLWASLAIAAGGLLWALIDRDGCTAYERLSNTRLVRLSDVGA